MTRLQKKCLMFSCGMHVLLLAIVLAGSAFSEKPAPEETPILTMFPANIVDRAGAGGGSPVPATVQPQQPQPTPPVFQPPQPARREATAEPRRAVEPVERPRPHPVAREYTEPLPESKEGESRPKPEKRKHHEITPTFTPATPKTKAEQAEDERAEAKAAARAEARRLAQIARTFDNLATGVKRSAAQATVVAESPGEGGGEAFAGYETVIYNIYYHRWVPPDNAANRLATTDVRIVVARDGTIVSSEIVRRSGEEPMDKSVDRVLREVTKLPPFPAGARDEQRTFIIRFDLESKEGSG